MMIFSHQLKVLSKWTSSHNDLDLYKQLIRDIQTSQSMKQLSLIMTVLMCH